jgi:glyceraldehyde 3-phosphate dehydrogenase
VATSTLGINFADLTVVVDKATTKEEVNAAFKAAASTSMKNILRYEERPLVLQDYVGDPHSCIIDADLTQVMNGNLIKAFGWYDNEWGYSNRIVELAEYIGARL